MPVQSLLLNSLSPRREALLPRNHQQDLFKVLCTVNYMSGLDWTCPNFPFFFMNYVNFGTKQTRCLMPEDVSAAGVLHGPFNAHTLHFPAWGRVAFMRNMDILHRLLCALGSRCVDAEPMEK